MGKDRNNKFKGGKTFKGSTWNKKRKADDADWADRVDFENGSEGAGGSYPLEEVKAMDEYQRRMCHDDAPKRKYALALAYCGTNYQGLQVNPGAVTVEGVLERALFLSGGIQEANYGTFQKVAWTRAARTDRGVHAVGQCCSMKLTIPEGYEKQYIEDVNTFLPPDIRAITVTKTTRSFNARSHCSHRRYQFLLPTYLFTALEDVNSKLQAALQRQGEVVDAGRDGSFAPPSSTSYVGKEHLATVRAELVNNRATAQQLEVFRAAMTRYQGTHNYHNFTSSKVVTAAGSVASDTMKRYMMDISVSEPFTSGGEGEGVDLSVPVEWVRITLLGQSFLLNQIRKMIGLAVDVTRTHRYPADPADFNVDISLMDKCLAPNLKINVPVIPGLGLHLDELFFDKYNVKLDFEAKKLEAAVVNREAKKAKKEAAAENEGAEDTESGTGSGVDTAVREGAGGEEKGEAGSGCGSAVVDKLQWAEDPEVETAFQNFREQVLWPHIYSQEQSSLDFMFYLDYLRVVPHSYTSGPVDGS